MHQLVIHQPGVELFNSVSVNRTEKTMKNYNVGGAIVSLKQVVEV
jgi:hypothetical protein